jgi:plastocyanin
VSPRLGSLALLGCVGLAPPVWAGETIRVAIEKLKFDPPQVSARIGDTIEWANDDFIAHTATARNKDWDVTIPPKGSARVTLQHAGEVDYFCRFHPNMTGRILAAPE